MIVSTAKLADIAEIIAGQSPPSSTYNRDGIGLPFFQGKADFGKVNPKVRVWCNAPQKTAEPGDILISVRAPVGPTNICDTKACIGRGLSAIRVNHKIKSEYLLAYLRANESRIASLGKGSTFKAITQKDLQNLQIPVPSIEEQAQFINAYNLSNSLIEKRKKATDLLDEYIKSVFLNMFGDPNLNPNKYEKSTIQEIADKVTDGEHITPIRTTDGIKLLSARNIKNGYLDFNAGVDYIGEVEYERIRKRCNPELGDVLISCSGTIGRVTTVDIDEPFTLVRSAALIKPNRNLIISKYLEYFLRTDFSQREMMRSVNQSSQANLFLGQINKLSILLPPISKQLDFVNRFDAVASIKQKMVIQSYELENQFQALMQKAFNEKI